MSDSHYLHLVEKRDAVLSTARMSLAARARVMGQKPRAPMVAKEHRITWDLRTGTQTIETTDYAELMRARPIQTEPEPEPQPKKRIGLGPRRHIPKKSQQVVAAFCKAFGVGFDDVLTPARSRKFARPRQAAMHFMHQDMKLSQPVVGRFFKRDHTTILHARNKVAELLGSDETFRERYHRAVRAIRALWNEK